MRYRSNTCKGTTWCTASLTAWSSTNGTAYVIDYKTHQWADRDSLPRLTDSYREQMRLYTNGVQKLWPRLTVKPCLLFTACGELVAMDEPL